MIEKECKYCHGKRLKPEVLAVTINGKNIIEICEMSIKEALEFFKGITLTEKQEKISKEILKEIRERLNFMINVGLDYLSLFRATKTLSGGESQRIRLATQIGSGLTGVLYVLDEPSIGLHQRDNDKLLESLTRLRDIGNTLVVVEHEIGSGLTGVLYVLDEPSIGLHQRDNDKLLESLTRLRDIGNTLVVVEHDEDTMNQADWILDLGRGIGLHQRDNDKLLESLTRLRDIGNTLVVVEHDEDTMNQADWILDLGRGAGEFGGDLVAFGTPSDIKNNPNSLTGEYLNGTKKIEVPDKRRTFEKTIKLFGAKGNNLKNIDVEIPLGVMTVVTGVSGSGKSTLINQTLYPILFNELNNGKLYPLAYDKIEGSYRSKWKWKIYTNKSNLVSYFI